MCPYTIRLHSGEVCDGGRTIKESIQVVILEFAQFQEILARPRTFLRLEIDNQLPEGGLQHDRHRDEVLEVSRCMLRGWMFKRGG